MATERLELIVSTKGVRVVERQLVSIGDKAEKAGARAEKLGNRIDKGASRGAKSLQRTQSELRRTGNEAETAAGRANSLWKSLIVPAATGSSLRETGRALNSLAGRFAAFYTGRVLVGIADEFGRLNNILSGFGVAAGEIDKVRKSINDVANAARVDAVQAATLFGRLRQATKGLGLSSRELVSIVGTVNKALRLGGASSLEASQSIRQLSQAFNKGKLDGDEFRSVMENAPILQDLLTEKLGVTKDALFDLAAQGKITATDLVGAFQQGAEAIDEAYGNRITTLGDALTVLKNEFREAFGSQVSGPARVLAGAVIAIARNMDTLIQALSIFASVKIFQAAIAGAKTLLATLKSINIQAATGAIAGFFSGKGAVKGDYSAMTLQAMGKGGGATGMKGFFAGAGRALPVIGQVAMVATLIPIFVDLVKSLLGVGDAAKKVEGDLDKLNKYVQSQFLTGKGDPSRALPEVTLAQARKAAEFRDRATAKFADPKLNPKQFGQRVIGMSAVPTQTNVQRLHNEAIDRANKKLDESAKRILRNVKLGQDSLKGFGEDVVRSGAPDLQRMFELLDAARAARLEDTGITEGAAERAFSNAVGRELSVTTEELDKVLGSVGFRIQDIIPIWRNYRDAIPLTEQEKMGDSFNRTKNEIAKYEKRLAEISDPLNKVKGESEDLANAQAFLKEKINALGSPLGQQNLKMVEQLKLMNALGLAQKQLAVEGFDTTSKDFLPFDTLDEKQKLALADPSTFNLIAQTFSQKGLNEALRQLDILIKINEERERGLAPIEESVAKEREAAAAAANRLSILQRIRAETDAIGKSPQEQQRALFEDAPQETAREFEEAIGKFNQTTRRDFVVSELEKLESAIVQLERLQKSAAAAGLPAEDQKFIGDFTEQLKSEVAGLGPAIAKVGGEAARPLLEETASFLESRANEVGTTLGSALVRGFNAAVKAGNIPIGASAPAAGTAPGSVARFPTEEVKGGVQQFASGISGIQSQITQLRNELQLFGSLAGTQFKRAGSAAQNTANDIQGFFESAFGTLEDALVEFVTTGEFDFKKFINAIIADLARLVIRMLIIRPLMNFFGGIFGFGFANGGLVGQGGTLKKFSNGGQVGGVGGSTSDNQLIMASAGEFVVTRAGVDRAGINNLKRLNAGGSLRSERRTVGSSTINFAPQITVINEGGSGQDGQQQGEQIGTMVRQSFTELLMKETRPGGMLESVNRKGFA